MVTSFEAVDNIIKDRKDKSNIWNVNTEGEYHEQNKMAVKVAVSLMGAVSIGIVFFILFYFKGLLSCRLYRYYYLGRGCFRWKGSYEQRLLLRLSAAFWWTAFNGSVCSNIWCQYDSTAMWYGVICNMLWPGTCFLLRSMNFSYKWSVFGVSALFLIVSISEKLREIFWCHIIYYSLGLLLLW